MAHRGSLWLALSVLGGVGWLVLPSVHAAESGSDVTIRGEVVDPASYLKEGRHGPEMTSETYEAADGGQTLAILEDGTGALYLLLGEHPGDDPSGTVYDLVNEHVTVTGKAYERGGLKGLVPASAQPVDAAPAAGTPSAGETPAPTAPAAGR